MTQIDSFSKFWIIKILRFLTSTPEYQSSVSIIIYQSQEILFWSEICYYCLLRSIEIYYYCEIYY